MSVLLSVLADIVTTRWVSFSLSASKNFTAILLSVHLSGKVTLDRSYFLKVVCYSRLIAIEETDVVSL